MAGQSFDHDDKHWATVGEAWKRVASESRSLGQSIIDALRSAYKSEEDPLDPEKREGFSEITETIERSIKAVRATVDEPEVRATMSENTKRLTSEFESALKVSLGEMGRALTKLSDQL